MNKLLYQPELENKKVQFQYKRKANSKKWQTGFINLCYSRIAYQYAIDLTEQENFYKTQFIIFIE